MFMKRILLVKISSMGDIIHNMPLVHDLKTQYPDAQIDWVVEEAFAGLAKLNPLVSRVIPVALRRWKKSLFSAKTWAELFAFKRTLQETNYDAILDTQGLIKSALLCRLANGSSYGRNTESARERLAGFLYQYPLSVSHQLHAVIRNRLGGSLALNYAIDETKPCYDIDIRDIQTSFEIPENFIIAFHSTARDAKHWPTEYWIECGQQLNQKGFCFVLPWGDETEKSRAVLIAKELSNAMILPKLSIVQLAKLISKAKAAIGLDTGLTHIAVVLNIPTVAIFTDTHIWQAGTHPSVIGRAITIGGKPAKPTVNQAMLAFDSLNVQKS